MNSLCLLSIFVTLASFAWSSQAQSCFCIDRQVVSAIDIALHETVGAPGATAALPIVDRMAGINAKLTVRVPQTAASCDCSDGDRKLLYRLEIVSFVGQLSSNGLSWKPPLVWWDLSHCFAFANENSLSLSAGPDGAVTLHLHLPDWQLEPVLGAPVDTTGPFQVGPWRSQHQANMGGCGLLYTATTTAVQAAFNGWLANAGRQLSP